MNEPEENSRIDLQRELFETRFNAYDKAIDLLQKQADKSPTIGEVARDVQHLRELMESRFDAVAQKFEGNAIALIAAFAASKEAVSEQQKSNTTAISKSEAATGEQLRQLQALWATSSAAQSEKIEDLRTRWASIEAVKLGQKEEKATTQQTTQHSNTLLVAIVVASISFAGLLFQVISTRTSANTLERAIVQEKLR